MPGCPPRHVCVAERRLLLTYLLTYTKIAAAFTKYYAPLYAIKPIDQRAKAKALKTLHKGNRVLPPTAAKCDADITKDEVLHTSAYLPTGKSPEDPTASRTSSTESYQRSPPQFSPTCSTKADARANSQNARRHARRHHQRSLQKKDRSDPRNYRPITLLNNDHKILMRILTQRMNEAVLQFVSRDQNGFVPACVPDGFIAENVLRLQLLQELHTNPTHRGHSRSPEKTPTLVRRDKHEGERGQTRHPPPRTPTPPPRTPRQQHRAQPTRPQHDRPRRHHHPRTIRVLGAPIGNEFDLEDWWLHRYRTVKPRARTTPDSMFPRVQIPGYSSAKSRFQVYKRADSRIHYILCKFHIPSFRGPYMYAVGPRRDPKFQIPCFLVCRFQDTPQLLCKTFHIPSFRVSEALSWVRAGGTHKFQIPSFRLFPAPPLGSEPDGPSQKPNRKFQIPSFRV